jgi:uncharacterized protein YaiE (UPF0345 family)
MRTPSLLGRLVVLVLVVGILSALVTVFITGFVLRAPSPLTSQVASQPRIAVGANAGQQETVIHLETVGAVSDAVEFPRPNDPHPDWVSYLPTTTFNVPANSIVTMVIDQEDSASGLRNPFWAQARGIIGPFHMKYLDDQGNTQEGDFTKLDDASTPAHTFAIPDLGVFVPLLGVPDSAPAGTMNTITFSFRVGKPGVYRWQCFVPCGSGTIYGNGGPMQTIGYMGGFLIVH